VPDRQAGPHRLLGLGELAKQLQQTGALVDESDTPLVLLQRVGPTGERGLGLAVPFQQQS
jgi:hypothetical protein